jgi:coenzyme F420-reducing hydrogenase beta subunit
MNDFPTCFVGYVREGDWRLRGTSGGLCRWLQAELIRRGMASGAVSVVPGGPSLLFEYRVVRTVEEVRNVCRSVYHPIQLDPAQEAGKLSDAEQLVFVGLPCHLKQPGRFFKYRFALMCNGTKEESFLADAAKRSGLEQVQQVDFRVKSEGPFLGNRNSILLMRGTAKGESRIETVSFAANWARDRRYPKYCWKCPLLFGPAADVTFGDAWVPPHDRDWRGTNVVLVRNRALEGLLREAAAAGRIHLQEVGEPYLMEIVNTYRKWKRHETTPEPILA